ncbi:MAG TPA: hypothetical protein VFA15_02955 [Nitrososphaera sp.]|nr:hypothetical protein [Nitrososphaera sp.]
MQEKEPLTQRQTYVIMTEEGFDEGDRSAMIDPHPVMRSLRRLTTLELRSSASPEVLARFQKLF